MVVRLVPLALMGCVATAVFAGGAFAADETAAGTSVASASIVTTTVDESVPSATGDQAVLGAYVGPNAANAPAPTADAAPVSGATLEVPAIASLDPAAPVLADTATTPTVEPSATQADATQVAPALSSASTVAQMSAVVGQRHARTTRAMNVLHYDSSPYTGLQASQPVAPASDSSNTPVQPSKSVPSVPLASGFLSSLMAATGFAVIPSVTLFTLPTPSETAKLLLAVMPVVSLVMVLWLGYSYLLRRTGYANAARSGLVEASFTLATSPVMSFVGLPQWTKQSSFFVDVRYEKPTEQLTSAMHTRKEVIV